MATAVRSQQHNERGVILVITALIMTSLLTFTAIAVDIGMRNDLLARDQHAIDAATLAAIRRVNIASFAGESLESRMHAATLLAHEIVWSNTGIPTSAWATCTDSRHFPQVDPMGGGTCVSFDVNPTGMYVARVTLPQHAVDAIFGRITGAEEYQLAAAANADGNTCDTVANPGCDADPTTTAPTTSIDPWDTTTIDPWDTTTIDPWDTTTIDPWDTTTIEEWDTTTTQWDTTTSSPPTTEPPTTAPPTTEPPTTLPPTTEPPTTLPPTTAPPPTFDIS